MLLMMKARHELRYFIPPETALRIRDFVREYMDLDEYSVGRPDSSYPVHTLYLDSDDWKIYWRAVNGNQDRWKLRLRYYDDRPDSPVFCEVKHQMTDVIVKHRSGVKREALESVLDGHVPHREQFTHRNPKHAMAVEHFVAMMLELNASPRLHISCLREAYESLDGQGRVTFDRDTCVSEVFDNLLATRTDDPLIHLDQTVILKLRFAERFPNWYRDMVRTFGLGEPLLWKDAQAFISCIGLRLTREDLIYNIVL